MIEEMAEAIMASASTVLAATCSTLDGGGVVPVGQKGIIQNGEAVFDCLLRANFLQRICVGNDVDTSSSSGGADTH